MTDSSQAHSASIS